MNSRQYQRSRRRLRRDYKKIIADTEQLIRDIEAWNAFHPHETPHDCERDRVHLATFKKALAAVEAGQRMDQKTIDDLLQLSFGNY